MSQISNGCQVERLKQSKSQEGGHDTDVMSLLVMALKPPSANQLNQSCAEHQSCFLCITEPLSNTADHANP